MQHHIHHTQGFILSSRNIGEANKLLSIYTRELGLVKATAQGIRRAESKLRFSLQDFSHASIDFVHGKDIWRVTSATNISTFPLMRANKESILIVARISKLIERLCAGEEPNEKIFDDFIQALYLLDSPNFSSESLEALELHLVLRIVNELGYIGDSEILAKYLEDDFSNEKTSLLLAERKSIISHINKALRESQL